MPLDLLRVPSIDLHEFVTGLAFRFQQLVELGVDRLRVAMLCSLDDKGHE